MEFADYPKHLRDKWSEIKKVWRVAFDRRGSKRYEAIEDLRDWLMSILHGYEKQIKKLDEDWECRFAKEMWKSEEWARAERLEESLCKLEDKIYEQKMQIYALQDEIAALKPQDQEKAGVNQQKALPEQI